MHYLWIGDRSEGGRGKKQHSKCMNHFKPWKCQERQNDTLAGTGVACRAVCCAH